MNPIRKVLGVRKNGIRTVLPGRQPIPRAIAILRQLSNEVTLGHDSSGQRNLSAAASQSKDQAGRDAQNVIGGVGIIGANPVELYRSNDQPSFYRIIDSSAESECEWRVAGCVWECTIVKMRDAEQSVGQTV